MSAEAIARALGGHKAGAGWVCRCPAHEDREPSLSLRDGADGRLLANCFAGCAFEDVLAALRGLGLLEARGDWREPALPRPKPKPSDDEAGRLEGARRIWREAVEPRGTLVETHLNGRGLALGADVAGRVLRFHPALRFEGGTAPAMVALFTDLRTDEPRGIHRTFLSREGAKLGRKMLGPCGGAAIKLDGDDWVELGLGIAEGIETALAARSRFRPMWVLGAAGAIGKLTVLGGIEALTIFADADQTGQDAARECAARWTAAGVEVAIRTAECGDFNDHDRQGP